MCCKRCIYAFLCRVRRRQCVRRLLFVVPFRTKHQFGAVFRGQHHYPHDALGIYAYAVFGQLDAALKSGRRLRDERGGAGVQAQTVVDFKVLFYH